jgi:hypothetical protein
MTLTFDTKQFQKDLKELQQWADGSPSEAARRLQSVLVKSLVDHRKEVARSSDFKVIKPSNLTGGDNKGLLRIFPRPTSDAKSQVIPRRLEDVQGSISTYWGASEEDQTNAVGARVEKQTGPSVVTPTQRQYLLIPMGDFRTANNMPKRTGKRGQRQTAPKISDLPNTYVKNVHGDLLLIQRLDAGKAGLLERKGGSIKGVKAKDLGERERVVGLLKTEARQTHPLDFFGSWDRLEATRDASLDRMLDDLVIGRRNTA